MITKKSDIDYSFSPGLFDEEHDFEYNNAVYEKLNGHHTHEFRIILSDDDYDYVEDEELLKKLRVAYDEHVSSKPTTEAFFIFRVVDDCCEYLTKQKTFSKNINDVEFLSEQEASDTCDQYDGICGSCTVKII